MLGKILIFFKYLFFMIITLPRDVRAFFMVRRIKSKSTECDRKDYSVSAYFERWVKSQPQKACLVCDDQKWTFKDVIWRETRRFH